MLSNKIRNKVLLAILIIIPMGLMLPTITDFHYPPGGGYSDLVVTHYPNLLFLQKTIQSQHTIPLWNPLINSGYPFDADPLSGLWYPFGWLALLFPLPLGINLTILLHIIWGSIGMALFMRENGVDDRAAFFTGLVWGMLPKLFGHFDAGHVTLIYAVSWTPWLYLSLKEIYSGRNSWIRYLSPGLIMGLIILADLRWILFAGLGFLVYLILIPDARANGPAGESATPKKKQERLRKAGQKILFFLRQCLVSLLVGSPILIPLSIFVLRSTRMGLQTADNFFYSLPLPRLLGLIYPDYMANAEWVIYPGVCCLLLACCSLFRRNWRREDLTWGVIFLGSILWALGSNLSFLKSLTGLPGINLLRVPARTLFLTDFALIVASGYFLDDLIRHENYQEDFPKTKFWCNLTLAGLSAFSIAIGFISSLSSGVFKTETIIGMMGILVGSVLIYLLINTHQNKNLLISSLMLICAIDLGCNDVHYINSRSVAAVLAEQDGVTQYLDEIKGAFRVYSPSYSLPQQSAAYSNIELANGVHPLQIAEYRKFMNQATGVPDTGYSVTIPSFQSNDLSHANEKWTPNAELLGLLNVRFVLSEFDLHSPDLLLTARIGETRIYQNIKTRQRAWLELDGQIIQGANFVRVLPSNNPNQVDVMVNTRGKLVLSEINYPGWIAEVDGHRVDIYSAYGILRSIDVPKGEHVIHFIYRPTWTIIGVVLSLITIAGVLINERLNRISVEKMNERK